MTLYDDTPCGHLTTSLDGEITEVNTTLLTWLGRSRDEVVGRGFADLLSVGGKLYHETHYAPMVRMHGEAREIAFELRAADGHRIPVLVTAKARGDVVRVTLFDARERRAYERELLRARQEAERDRERLHRLNTTLQRTLLPPALPDVPGMEVAAHYHAASSAEIGGDFYDLFPLTADRWGFFLGDVCGKGPRAAVLTSLTRYTLRAAAVYDTDAVAVLTNLNNVLLQENHADAARFCTVGFGVLVPSGDGFALTIASGGHPPALVIRASGTVEALRTPGGQLVGILPEARFVATSTTLGPGDALLLYTDGLTEARRADDVDLGEERLSELVTAFAGLNAKALVSAVADVLTEWDHGPPDDTAILAFSVPGRSSGP